MTDDPARAAPTRRHLLAVAQVAALGLVVVLLSLLVWSVVHRGEGGALVAAVKRGDAPTAPGFYLPVIWNRPALWPERVRPALRDGEVGLTELRGTPVVLNFWASWCIPCKEEAPYLAAAARAHRREVAFLGFDIQDLTRDARRFLREVGVPYPSVRDPGNGAFTAYGLTGVPETYYIDGQGRIVAHAAGAVSRRELERDVRLLLGEEGS